MSCVLFRELVRRMTIPVPISDVARVLEMRAIQNGTGVSSKMEIAPSFRRIISEMITSASEANPVPIQMKTIETTRTAVDGIASRTLG